MMRLALSGLAALPRVEDGIPGSLRGRQAARRAGSGDPRRAKRRAGQISGVLKIRIETAQRLRARQGDSKNKL
jgi:hypothetical protein